MVKEFHMVGIPISQATEFDHRLAKPIYQTQTKADGSYKMEGIEEGAYNLVAVRQGYGWKYLYEAEVAKEAKTVTAENIVLYPEMEVSGVINQYTVWPSEHYIIAKGDVVVPEGETLIIDKGAVIRFDGFYELQIEGSLQVNGEESIMVIFTSNFSEVNAGDWQAIRTKGEASAALVKWAKLEYAEGGIECIEGIINVENCRAPLSLLEGRFDEVYQIAADMSGMGFISTAKGETRTELPVCHMACVLFRESVNGV